MGWNVPDETPSADRYCRRNGESSECEGLDLHQQTQDRAAGTMALFPRRVRVRVRICWRPASGVWRRGCP